MKISIFLGFFLIYSSSGGRLNDLDVLKILHELFPPLRPTLPPIVISPITYPKEPALTEIPPVKHTTTNAHDGTDHFDKIETTTQAQATTFKPEESPEEKINKELKRDVLQAVAQITDILLQLRSKTLTIVSAILPTIGYIIDRLSTNIEVL
ncbi:uncharacterized protein LOC123320083 isoform X2 [Coccinella septempunctata]|uniref:uncharacterized protein LOC123320083 isoform X2 n=1 Tax=Coccinella septempunctata TaxID=41139 RepID=UPI001D06EB03|nr:uncharacterized protein LOC123320083 isoform X2 [Coccinella septempunctata]